jgi:hypothetical protein
MYGIHQYHKIQDQKNLEASRLAQQATLEYELVAEPQAPYYKPKEGFSFLDYEQQERRVSKYYVRYTFVDPNDTPSVKSVLSIQQLEAQNDHSYYKEKPTQINSPGKVIEVFEYDTFYGYIYKYPKDEKKKTVDVGEESYNLYWSNDLLSLNISVSGFPGTESETDVAELLKSALFQLEKIE